ncbi:MAG TPA: LysM domain-containing protein [Gaiellaceae bacterium]|nr:LysM domain-containing protein [Gaiellaceae bacterium]
MERGWRTYGKRFAAPAAFLLAATVAVLLVRSGLEGTRAAETTTVRTRTVVNTPAATTTAARKRRRYYRLKAGETLSDVAIRFQTSVERLLALNPGIQPTNLTVGERVRVK